MGILQESRGEAALPGQSGGPGELQDCQPSGAAWKAPFKVLSLHQAALH